MGQSAELIAAAASPRTPETELLDLVRHGTVFLRQKVVRNEGATLPVLALLARDVEGQIRADVARHPAVSRALLDTLALDPAGEVRAVVASRPETSVSVLDQLAGDDSRYVRLAVGGNPAASSEALTALSFDSVDSVRKAVARNASTPIAVLEDFLRAQGAYENISLQEHVVQNPAITPELLDLASLSQSWTVRLQVAKHPRAPFEVLARLAVDSQLQVRREVIFNPGAAPHLRRQAFFGSLAHAGNYNHLYLERMGDLWPGEDSGLTRDEWDTAVSLAENFTGTAVELETLVSVLLSGSNHPLALDVAAPTVVGHERSSRHRPSAGSL